MILGFVSCVICLEIVACSNVPRLVIFPEVEKKTLALGSSFMATCKVFGVSVQNMDTNIKWYDPDGEEIIESAGVGRTIYTLKDTRKPEKKLFFNEIRGHDEGVYSCSAMVEGNIQTRKISIKLYKDITFDHAPSPQFKTLHKTQLVECRVSGNPAPTVEWLFKGNQLELSGKYSQEVYGLYISNVTKADEGVYLCQASVVDTGRFKARSIDLIVQEPPLINKTKLDYEGVQSYEFTLPCKATGKPEPRYEFFKDNNTHQVHTTSKRHFDTEGGYLTFRPLTEDDHGEYTCKAFNNAGDDKFRVKLNVVVPPSIYSFQNRTGDENRPYTLKCLSYGKPSPNITFKKVSLRSFSDPTKEFHEGQNEDGRINVHKVGDQEMRMDFKYLKATDYSNYTCLSRNKGGMHERNATITVYFKPQFDPANIRSWYIWPGKTRNLTCLSYAEPMPMIEWIKYKEILKPIYNNRTFRVHLMGKNSNLQVTAREEDQNWIYGKYYCVVKNQYGTSNLSIELKYGKIPGRPKEVRSVDVTSNTVLLEVDLPEDNGGEKVLGYRIDYESIVLNYAIDDEIFIEYLRPSTTFVFQIRAYSEVGVGHPQKIHVKTEDVQRPERLVLTGAEEAGYAYKYTIHWVKPLTGGLPIKEYKFRFRKVDLIETVGIKRTFRAMTKWTEIKKYDTDPDLEKGMRFYVLNNLKQNSYYEVVVSARNDIGYSNGSEPFVFKTDQDPFSSPSETDPESSAFTTQPLSSFTYLLAVIMCLL